MKTIKQCYVLLVFSLLLIASSCVDDIFVEGNGELRSESRGASGFSTIASNGDFKVLVTQGNDYSVVVKAESNLLSYIETDVVGNTLKIRTRGVHSLRQNYPIEVTITTPELNGLSLSGSGLIKANNIESNNFNVSISGSGDIDAQISANKVNAQVAGSGIIYLEGDADESNFNISGSGKIKSFDLEHQFCESVISGSGDMYVNASQTIDTRISGSGRLYYVGYPVIHSSISGSGKVVNKN